MNNLIQLVVEWARVAYNWLKQFFKIVWGLIQSYWPKLKKLVEEWLEELTEVIILDGREAGGREILETLKKYRPSEIDDINSLVTLGIDDDNSIVKVGNLEAQAQQQDKYDSMMSQKNGILRING